MESISAGSRDSVVGEGFWGRGSGIMGGIAAEGGRAWISMSRWAGERLELQGRNRIYYLHLNT